MYSHNPVVQLSRVARLMMLPTITCDHIKHLFGVELHHQVGQPHSDPVVVSHQLFKRFFVLYMEYGTWRVGGTVSTGIGELLELLDPVKYIGLTGISDVIAIIAASDRNNGYGAFSE